MSASRSATGLRVLAAPFVVAPPSGVATSTRLKVTPAEHEFVTMLGDYLGGLFRADLALLVREGGSSTTTWADRKSQVSAFTSSRWAGTVTKAANTQYRLGMRTLRAERDSLRARIEQIRKRAAVPIGWALVQGQPRPYRSEAERYAKLRRQAGLLDRLRKVEARIAAGRPRIVAGGGGLWRNRSNLTAAKLSETDWREQWALARRFLTANGETGRKHGNDTIKISPDGQVQIYIPAGLRGQLPAGLALTPDGTKVVLAAPVTFHHRSDVWADRVATNQAVSYTFTYDTTTRRWHVSAAWTYETPSVPLTYLQTRATLAVDFNADHFAAWIVDAAGNPVGPPVTFPCVLTGLPASVRDALLRHTITRILRYAKDHGCASLTVENLNFSSSSAGKDDPATSKRLRRTVAGMPTSQFRTRLVAMAATAAVALVAVDPAYTSKWGKEHWEQPLAARYTIPTAPAVRPAPAATTSSRTATPLSKSRGPQVSVTGHHAAAVVIGRRMFGHGARRQRMNGPSPAQRSRQGQPVPAETPAGTPISASPDRISSVPPVPASPSQPQAGQGSVTIGSPPPFTGQRAAPGSESQTLPK